MPKIISDYERKRTQEALIEHTKQLIIEKKGIKNVTVDDIVRAVGIPKGSFYSYYKSKEECFYNVIETALTDVYSQAKAIKQENISTREKATKFLREVYLADNRVGYYIGTTDIKSLFRKLPVEYAEMEQKFNGEGLVLDTMSFLEIGRAQAETFLTLLQCMEFSYHCDTPLEVKIEVIDVLVGAIADYVEKNSTM